MSRPRYPSDELLKELRNPAHFRLHCSVQNHPKMIEVFPDNHLFATYCRLGILCVDRGAAQTEDCISLSTFDLARVTSWQRRGRAMALLRSLAGYLKWTLKVRERPFVVTIHFRNFAKKQHFTPRKQRRESAEIAESVRENSGETPLSPSPSPYKERYKERSLDKLRGVSGVREAVVRLLVREIIALTRDEQQRSVTFFVEVASTLPETSTRRLISETRAAVGNGGEVQSVARLFTYLAKRELDKQMVGLGG